MRATRSAGVVAFVRAGLSALVLLGAGIAASYALAASSSADHAGQNVPGLPTITPPTFVVLTATSTVTSNATSVVVGTPFTLSVLAQFGSGNTGFDTETEQINGFGPDLTLQSGVSDRGSCNDEGSSVQCPFGSVGNGSLIGATLVVVPTAPGTYQFTAQSLPQGAVSAGVSVNVVAETADLGLQGVGGTLAPKLGHRVRVGILVANAGPAAATLATLTLTLPAEVSLVGVRPAAGVCQGKPLTCQLGGLASGARDLVVLTLEAVKPGEGRLLASVSGQPSDPSLANNDGSIAIRVPHAPRPTTAPNR